MLVFFFVEVVVFVGMSEFYHFFGLLFFGFVLELYF